MKKGFPARCAKSFQSKRTTLTSCTTEKTRRQSISVSVFNEGEGLDRVEMKKIFRRFYRSDASRTRETGGCGLGLSIAESIAEAHNGSISVDGEKGCWIEFTLHLK